jgi:hypothetical protein
MSGLEREGGLGVAAMMGPGQTSSTAAPALAVRCGA